MKEQPVMASRTLKHLAEQSASDSQVLASDDLWETYSKGTTSTGSPRLRPLWIARSKQQLPNRPFPAMDCTFSSVGTAGDQSYWSGLVHLAQVSRPVTNSRAQSTSSSHNRRSRRNPMLTHNPRTFSTFWKASSKTKCLALSSCSPNLIKGPKPASDFFGHRKCTPSGLLRPYNAVGFAAS